MEKLTTRDGAKVSCTKKKIQLCMLTIKYSDRMCSVLNLLSFASSVPESVELELFLLLAIAGEQPLRVTPFIAGEAGGEGDIRSSLSTSLSGQELGERFPGYGT